MEEIDSFKIIVVLQIVETTNSDIQMIINVMVVLLLAKLVMVFRLINARYVILGIIF